MNTVMLPKPMFWDGDVPRARRTDRVTSHAGADRSAASRQSVQDRVLELFEMFGDMTDDELTARYRNRFNGAHTDTPRKRRSDLTRDKVVVPVMGVTREGQQVWGLKGAIA
jgi:hypothetical protein